NVDYLKKLSPIISKDCIITDVGSVKGNIHKAIDEMGLSGQFIGGHPMTGSEKTGFAQSSAKLLENAYYVLTTNEPALADKVDEFAGFLSMLGAIPIRMTPEDHDHATAAISHLPHLIAAALVNLVHDNDDPSMIMKTIAAGGFRDLTRIASSSPVMWQHICMANREEILKLLDIYDGQLERFREAVEQGDERGLMSLFSAAKNYRDSMPIKSKGILPAVYECYLDVYDKVGSIAGIATRLADCEINIKNIGIVNNREFEDGALRIEFYNEEDLSEAVIILGNTGYRVIRVS
ncbi:MAG: prephenate dehydrogenase, partial [Lachnospiraceae bacterium]|nr:prephenate dehydrogenase [Lachnospiraceae bacterium]